MVASTSCVSCGEALAMLQARRATMMARTIPNMAFLPPLQIRAQTADLGAGRTSAFEKKRRMKMVSLGLFVRLEAKPGKEQEVAAFLSQALQMANQEETTRLWF